MEKVVALASALCILALATIAHCEDTKSFDVEGHVYCDPCRVEFMTRLSEFIEGATVKLECRNIDNSTVTFTAEGKTDSRGRYSLTVEGDHEEDICEVRVVSSPREGCNEPMDQDVDRARIVCTSKSGIHDRVRYANPIGFVTKQPAEGCKAVLEELGMDLEDISDQ